MKSIVLISLSILMISSCNEIDDVVLFHKSHESNRSNMPFSDVVETDDLLFLSGQIGKNHKTGELVEGGITAETKQVIENIKDILEHHKLSLDHVIKCTVILRDIEDFSAFNEVYMSYFYKKPARTTFAACGLAGGASVEIDVIAVK